MSAVPNQAEARNELVRAVLLAATEPLGPTEIARRINQPWCVIKDDGFPAFAMSAPITPILRRIGAIGIKGKYMLPKVAA